MNIKNLKLSLVVASLFFTQVASAYTINLGGDTLLGEGLVSSQPGVFTTNFNDGFLPANYSGGLVVTGNISGQYASPPNDTSAYFTVGGNAVSPGVVSFGFLASYFGFFGGSPDTYNGLQLFNGNVLLKTITGADIVNPTLVPNGDQTKGYYFNIFADNSSEYFNRVAFTSTSAAFETDNHAVLAAVPEPETYAMMMIGLGMMGAVARRRKQK